jgi:hypothetical protein
VPLLLTPPHRHPAAALAAGAALGRHLAGQDNKNPCPLVRWLLMVLRPPEEGEIDRIDADGQRGGVGARAGPRASRLQVLAPPRRAATAAPGRQPSVAARAGRRPVLPRRPRSAARLGPPASPLCVPPRCARPRRRRAGPRPRREPLRTYYRFILLVAAPPASGRARARVPGAVQPTSASQGVPRYTRATKARPPARSVQTPPGRPSAPAPGPRCRRPRAHTARASSPVTGALLRARGGRSDPSRRGGRI